MYFSISKKYITGNKMGKKFSEDIRFTRNKEVSVDRRQISNLIRVDFQSRLIVVFQFIQGQIT